ncbi:hypothetical protein K2173_022370 [Erythroxylum novogranatense]|uniref:Uncharacterized protein n=1 Tax=Erythroxylum novogranatense TaxID=1862640 RepID=A0AAV8THJ4_9ROSI|nr:hypothetical protein K2173_022370 [Erythroxylum novogranatense]
MAAINRLSTQEVMRVARQSFRQLSSKQRIEISTLKQLFDAAVSRSVLSDEEIKDVELALLLVASTHKYCEKQLDEATKFLSLCRFLSSNLGNAVQRVVHYFTRALQERIAKESGIVISEGLESRGQILHPEQTSVGLNPALAACSLQLPYVRVTQFTAIQAVVENLGAAKKVHFIDLAIRSGEHCTVLMQALATRTDRPVELLKITAVGTTSKDRIEATGRRLADFAETYNIPFEFKTVMVMSISKLKEDMLELNEDEAVAIYFWAILRNIVVAETNGLESLMGVLRNLKPRVMVFIDFEANHNSPIFIDRFHESLHFYSACFDGLDICTERADSCRNVLEDCLGQEILDVVAADDDKRAFRHMKMEDWRVYFTKLEMVEKELSMSAFYQAELMLKNSANGSLCSFDKNDKCLIIRWRETEMLSVSAWKFRRQKRSRRSSNTTLQLFS